MMLERVHQTIGCTFISVYIGSTHLVGREWDKSHEERTVKVTR